MAQVSSFSTTSIVQWNARGIRSKIHWLKFSPFATSDILVIQETFLTPSLDFAIPGKTIYRLDRASKGGGLLFAVNNKLSSSCIVSDFSDPGRVEAFGIKVWLSGRWLSLVNVYSAHGNFRDSWFNSLTARLHPPFLVLGDFNQKHVAWGNPQNTPGSEVIFNWLLHHNVCLLNSTESTHYSPHGASSLIDLSFSSADIFCHTHTRTHPDLFESDHVPIVIDVDFPSSSVYKRCLWTNWPAIDRAMNEWFNNNENLSYQEFHHVFRTSVQRNSRPVQIKFHGNPPWWDPHCAWLLGQKRKFLRLSKIHLSKDHWMEYKKYTALLKRHIRYQSKSYWNNVCSSADTSKIYNILKALSNRAPGADSQYLLTVDGVDIPDRDEQAHVFAEHFAEQQNLPGIPYDLSNSNVLWNDPFSLAELDAAINSTRNTTPGEDGITVHRLKAHNKHSKEKFLGILNQMFQSGTVPEGWMSALILPIWKRGRPKAVVGSYRPISLTSVPGKVMERMLLKRILDWIMTRPIVNDRHFGFLPNSDSCKALYVFYQDIRQARNKSEFVCAVKLDIQSAYDSVWRDALLYKMAMIGIGGNVALWIRNWLNNRTLKVKWRGYTSTSFCSSRGVPQGSVLSPVLFLVFMSDLFDCVDSGVRIVVYADDIILYCSDCSLESVILKLNEILRRIHKWCEHWHLGIRPDKCAAINLSRRPGTPIATLSLQGEDIPWHVSLKILGVLFDRNLTFKPHVKYIQGKCTKRLNIIKAVASPKWGVTTSNLIHIVNAIIRGLIEYACAIYQSASKTTLKPLDTMYNAALRFALGLPKWTPLFKLYRESNQSPLMFRRPYLTHCFYIRCSDAAGYNLPSTALSSDFVWSVCGTDVRSQQLIQGFWPAGSIADLVDIIDDHLPFQTKQLPSTTIQHYFSDHLSLHYSGYQVIATDASKDENKTSIAAINVTSHSSKAYIVHHLNSVFTAEVLALDLGIQSFVHSGNYLILTDSKSSLAALKSINHKSLTSIFHSYQILRQAKQ